MRAVIGRMRCVPTFYLTLFQKIRVSRGVKTLFLFAPHTYGVLNPVAKWTSFSLQPRQIHLVSDIH